MLKDSNTTGGIHGRKLELKKAKDGQFFFNLKAANGQIILKSEMYKPKGSATNGMESVKKNAPLDERYDRRESKKSEPYFVLLAANKQIIGQSEMYTRQQRWKKESSPLRRMALTLHLMIRPDLVLVGRGKGFGLVLIVGERSIYTTHPTDSMDLPLYQSPIVLAYKWLNGSYFNRHPDDHWPAANRCSKP